MVQPKTRYARSDGASVAYQVVGDGPRDLVFTQGFVSNVDLWWEMPTAVRIFERLASFSRLILWDKRGTGLSDPADRVPTLDERVRDLTAVMEAAGSERAALFGISEGGPMSLLFAATHPERTSALVLYGTSPRFGVARDWPWGWQPDEFQGWMDDIDRAWGDGAMAEVFAPTYADNEWFRQSWGRFLRSGASPAMGRAVLEAAREVDCRDILPAVRVPTLILHRRGDRIVRVEGSRYMAERIPGARLVEFPGDDHTYTVGDTESIVDEIEEFLTGVRPGRTPDRVLATVLFTDIVGSTERAAQLGDHGWRELLAAHDAAVRRELKAFGGNEVNWTGDGFLATFVAPSAAVRCAGAIRHAVGRLGLDVRAGLHTGECELLNGGQVGGLAVHIGARIAALAGPGQILVSSTVRDLITGSGIGLADAGTHVLKGVPGDWRLFSEVPSSPPADGVLSR
jgi:pimeloyl-ACP methyl ester carboxylesterase